MAGVERQISDLIETCHERDLICGWLSALDLILVASCTAESVEPDTVQCRIGEGREARPHTTSACVCNENHPSLAHN